MKINKDTWHYNLWKKSFGYRENVPEETDLCRYCHKVFWQCLGIAAMAGMILALVVMCLVLVGMITYRGFWLNTLLTFKIIGIAAALIVPVVFYVRWLTSTRVRKVSNGNLVSQFLTAKKQSVCPLVEFSDED